MQQVCSLTQTPISVTRARWGRLNTPSPQQHLIQSSPPPRLNLVLFSEVKLSLASFLSDRIVDEILEALSSSQHTLVRFTLSLSLSRPVSSFPVTSHTPPSLFIHLSFLSPPPSLILGLSQFIMSLCLLGLRRKPVSMTIILVAILDLRWHPCR